MGRCRKMALALPILLLGGISAANGAVVQNGDFESTPLGADSSTTTFPNWTESAGGVAINAPTPLNGAHSAELVGSTATGNMVENPTNGSVTGPFSLSFKFAATDPGGNSNRTVNLIFGQNGASNQYNFRVIEGTTSPTTLGTLQVFDTSLNNWQNLVQNGVPFSTSLSTPTTDTLTIAGTVGGTYTATVNGVSSSPVSFSQGGAPANLSRVEFHTDNGVSGPYVVDDVSLVQTPEPSAFALLGVAGFGLLRRRGRR